MDHEAGDAAVEDQSVIEAAVGQRNKVAPALSDLRVEFAPFITSSFKPIGKWGLPYFTPSFVAAFFSLAEAEKRSLKLPFSHMRGARYAMTARLCLHGQTVTFCRS